MPSFTAVGELMLDLELARGDDPHAGRIRVLPGGTAANAAVWAASAGAESTCTGRVGADAAASAIRSALLERGVRPRLAVDPDEPTGCIAVVGGELIVDRGANRMLTVEDVGAIDTDVLLVSGYALLSDEHHVAAAALHGASARWSVVTSGSARLLDGALSTFLAATRRARIIVANLDEARILTGHDDADRAAHALGEDYELACVTAGAAGAMLAAGGSTEWCRTTASRNGRKRGAGDALAATLAVAFARGEAPAAALAYGCDAGARAAASPTGWP